MLPRMAWPQAWPQVCLILGYPDFGNAGDAGSHSRGPDSQWRMVGDLHSHLRWASSSSSGGQRFYGPSPMTVVIWAISGASVLLSMHNGYRLRSDRVSHPLVGRDAQTGGSEVEQDQDEGYGWRGNLNNCSEWYSLYRFICQFFSKHSVNFFYHILAVISCCCNLVCSSTSGFSTGSQIDVYVSTQHLPRSP